MSDSCFFVRDPHQVSTLSCACVSHAYAPVTCKTFPSKSPPLICVLLMCVILADTHPRVTFLVAQFVPWLSALMQSNPFFCHEICHLNLSLPPLALFLSHSLLYSYTNRRTPWRAWLPLHQHNCTELCEAGVNYDSVNYVYVEAEMCVCVCMLHKSGFLGNTDFNFKSFPGTLFKGRELINYVGKSLARF